MKSFRQNLKDYLFPEKLPPLQLTSRPVKVREPWGDSDNHKQATLGSLAFHVVVLSAAVAVSLMGVKSVAEKPMEQVMLIAPNLGPELPIMPRRKTMRGGGGGGDRDKIPAPRGRAPKQVLREQITPPAVVLRNDHPKLPVEPTVAVAPDVKLPSGNLPNLGDPLAQVAMVPSNGSGAGAGIGSGSGGGIGSGTGRGVGPGIGANYGGGVFRVGGGVSAPRGLYTPDPEYSEEARKARYQGTVVLWMIVDQNGKPRDIRVQRALGMGLDQKAIQAVRQWKFEPAKKDGVPVAVQINVEVNFHLY